MLSSPLRWPEGWLRTQPASRERWPGDRAGAAGSIQFAAGEIMRELRLLGARKPFVTSNMRLRRDGMPLAQQPRLAEPAVAIWFQVDGRQLCMVSDRYQTAFGNLRGLTLTIGALRGIERWGAAAMAGRTLRGFEVLPSSSREVPWWEVLGVSASASEFEIQLAYRHKAMQAHPDLGGSTAAMQALNAARDAGLRAVRARGAA